MGSGDGAPGNYYDEYAGRRRTARRRRAFLAAGTACALIVALLFAVVAIAPRAATHAGGDVTTRVVEAVRAEASEQAAARQREEEARAAAAAERERAGLAEAASYPRAWLAAAAGGLSAGQLVEVRAMGAEPLEGRVDGRPVGAPGHEPAGAGTAVVRVPASDGGAPGDDVSVPIDLVMVNLPDFLPDAAYDIAYASSAPSDCAGRPIPGVTGMRLDGYADGRQPDAHLGRHEYAAPCSYRTYVKLAAAQECLMREGYTLLFFDVYRPYAASRALSEGFAAAYRDDPQVRAGIAGWSQDWYVAGGVSGHNYGADVDVGLARAVGKEPMAMPSHFDALDPSGCLCAGPMAANAITEASYATSVSSNAACMALHRAMREAGFGELASEWWHFSDADGLAAMSEVMDEPGGFQASLL